MLTLDALTGTYIAGVSGGADSMALLDMAYQQGLGLVVCHVNYHKRSTAERDQEIVSSYCRQRNIPYYRYDAGQLEQGNFQQLARAFRYRCFAQLAKQHAAVGVLVAHHKDDWLESAVMRKRQKRVVSYYGIADTCTLYGVQVYRPLLSYWKLDLITYCQKEQISYGDDESNADITYERNRIRHAVLASYDVAQKNKMIAEFQQINETMTNKQVVYEKQLETLTDIKCIPLAYIRQADAPLTLFRLWLTTATRAHYHLSAKALQSMLTQLQKPGSVTIAGNAGWRLCKEYDFLTVCLKSEVQFLYVIHHLQEMETPWFKLSFQGITKQGMTVHENDFPLTIRSAAEGDHIALRFGTKRLSRFFIDRKIPKNQRINWPIVLNRANEVIFVYDLGCNCTHFTNTPNLFVVK